MQSITMYKEKEIKKTKRNYILEIGITISLKYPIMAKFINLWFYDSKITKAV